MCIAIVWKPSCDVLIDPLYYMTKKSWQKLKYLENEKSVQDDLIKDFSSFLKGFQSSEQHSFSGKWDSDFKFKCDKTSY